MRHESVSTGDRANIGAETSLHSDLLSLKQRSDGKFRDPAIILSTGASAQLLLHVLEERHMLTDLGERHLSDIHLLALLRLACR